jgi:hypothetical protein
MIRASLALASLLTLGGLALGQDYYAQTSVIVPSSGGPVAFTPLHIYYMSATGNDSNNGTSPGTAWATPNHSVVCGDVIVAAAGDYSATNFSNWGTVSTCPSTSGGLAASPGGIYFAVLLCGGADLEACHSNGQIWNMDVSNWAVEGWKVSNPGHGSANRAFQANGCGAVIHHFAYVNDITFNTASGYHTDNCGQLVGFGVDYFAVIGSIGQNAAQNTDFPEAAIDHVGTGLFDSGAGAHAIFYGDFTWNNTAATNTPFDTEGMMFDTWNNTAYPVLGVMANNVGWTSWRFCINLITGTYTGTTAMPTMKLYNNTCYKNDQNTNGDNDSAEIDLNIGNPWPVTINNNIAQATTATSPGGGGQIGAFISAGPAGASHGGNSGSSINGNIFTGVTGANGQNNYVVWDGNTQQTGSPPNILGVDPGFTNTTDLISNRNGAPTCTGFVNVTQCMGYNPATQTLTTPSVISDLTPNPNCGGVTGQCVGKGYQLPSTTCLTSGTGIVADYPAWLKGIVYLHWNGSSLTENADLVTRPCGM